jgi:cysteine desulfurase
MAYFDHNATSPVSVGVQEAVVSGLGEFGNPSSVHAKGRAARKIVEDAREEIARLVGALPENVIFTSGATEANNQALRSSGRKQVITSAIEHPSVLEISPDDPKIAVTANGVVELES